MNDRPPFLDRLADELEQGATAWRRRRRKRRRVLGGAMAVLLVAGGAVWFASSDDESATRPVVAHSPDTTVSQPGPTSSVPGVDSTVVIDAEPPTSESDPQRLLDDAVVAREDGVFVRRADSPNELVEIRDRSAFRAFLLGDTVVYQDAEPDDSLRRTPVGSIVVDEAGDVRRLEPDEGWELHLHDFAVVRGRQTVLASSVFRSGPEDSDHRLLLIDLESGDRTDLGSHGGWESGVSDARLAGDWMAWLRYEGVEQWVEAINVRSNQSLEIPLRENSSQSIAVAESEIWIVGPRFSGTDPVPEIELLRLILESGSDFVTTTIPLRTEGVDIPAGFCHRASVHGGYLICDQSSGPPLAIDLADDARTIALPGFDEGTVSFGALMFHNVAECGLLAPPLEGALELGPVDLDGDGLAEFSLAAVVDPVGRGDMTTMIQATIIARTLADGVLTTAIPAFTEGTVRTLPPIEITEQVSFLRLSGIVDLNGDGVAEVILEGSGNTAQLAMILRSDGCGLEEVVDEAGEGVRLQVGADGAGCDAIGACPVRNGCVTGPTGTVLESTIVRPQDGQVILTTTRYRLEESTLVELDRSEERFDSIDELPADAPTPEDSITIDC